jgi:hypothetical protein
MRFTLTALLLLSLLLTGSWALAGEGPAETPEKKKTEEELLLEKIVEIITRVKGSYEPELPIEQWNKIRDGARDELLKLGADLSKEKKDKLIAALLPFANEAKLKEILGKTDPEFASRVKKVCLELGWISPEMRESLKILLEKLRKDKIVPAEDGPSFTELGAFGAEALDAEFKKTRKQSIREKICEILGHLGNVGILGVVPTLLYATGDPEAPVRIQALRALKKTAEDDDNFKKMDKILTANKGYQILANHLAYDPDSTARLRSATVLGWMEAIQCTQVLYDVWHKKYNSAEEEKVTAEAVWALGYVSGVEYKEDEKWPDFERKVEAWYAKNKATLKKQMKPAKPAIRPKKKPKDGGKKG